MKPATATGHNAASTATLHGTRNIGSGLSGRGAGGFGHVQGLVHDAPDGAGTAAALRAATEAAIDLAGRTRLLRAAGCADVLVAQYVAGADDHQKNGSRTS